MNKSAWMWEDDGEVYGLGIDLETHRLRWFVHAGCMCDHDDSYADQTPDEFRRRGAPGGIGDPPADVAAEIDAALSALGHTAEA